MASWTDNQVSRLIQVWGDENVQEQLEGSKRNKHVYDSVAEELRIYGIEKTGEQCRCKMKKLRQEYKKVKDKNKETGNKRKKMKFFDELNEILGNKPSVKPPVLIDTLDSSASTEKLSSEEETGEVEEQDEVLSDDSAAKGRDVKVLTVATKASDKDSNGIKGKKRRRNKEEIIEEVITKAMKTVTDGLKESEKMFLEMEDRQMKFEERMREKDREFQMEMTRMMAGYVSQSSNHNQYPQYHSYPPPPQSGYYDPPDM